ncbi:MAG TPA: superoxide dismutase [Bacteroidales bacterium]|nr:superoxide dismutase [Bacteroidales bacterium]
MKRTTFLFTAVIISVLSYSQHSQLPLPYSANSLEPFIDSETMEIHYNKHHMAYINNLNKAIQETEFESANIDELQGLITESTPLAVRNNGGGHWNHTFFWTILTPEFNQPIPKAFQDAINKNFGSYDKFVAEFKKEALSRFGSGWAWLIVKDGKLLITSTPNQDNPLMPVAEVQGTPILGLDIWEHAYYLKYQNRRGDYIDAFFNIVDWQKVQELYDLSIKK